VLRFPLLDPLSLSLVEAPSERIGAHCEYSGTSDIAIGDPRD